jgi:formate hydrogenlyase subunit 3/multisubunit Na+/H+ antiporter MnhD subunit
VTLLLAGLGTALAGGLLALAARRSPRVANAAGAGGALAGGVLGLVPALRVLAGAPAESLRAAWQVPYGSFYVEMDPLSAFFLVPIFGLSALAAVYGAEYLGGHGRRRSLGPPWFFFDLLVASMALVVVARNGVLFLVAWEAMALSSFFLVTLEHEDEGVRAAGWTTLVATHLGTAFLLALFALLGREAGSLDFDRFEALGAKVAHLSGPLFLLAVVGFGTKAGFVPLHVWLPEAHPAAPSHVSAVMSGLMVKTGILVWKLG